MPSAGYGCFGFASYSLILGVEVERRVCDHRNPSSNQKAGITPPLFAQGELAPYTPCGTVRQGVSPRNGCVTGVRWVWGLLGEVEAGVSAAPLTNCRLSHEDVLEYRALQKAEHLHVETNHWEKLHLPLAGKSSEEIDHLKQALLARVPEGHSIGNKSLREALAWEQDLYLAVRSKLIEDGTVTTGRGRGGSVRRLKVVSAIENEVENQRDEQELQHDAFPNEASLYQPIIDVLRERWVKDQPFDQFVVENTSQGGRRADGIWTRPDITVAAMTTYTYVPGRHLDIVSFEIKHHTGFNVTAIYEALAHRRSATRAYVLAYIPDEKLPVYQDTVLADVQDEAARHGIGLIIAGDPNDFDTWEIKEDGTAFPPDPSRLNSFIRNQLSEGTRDQIVRWFR